MDLNQNIRNYRLAMGISQVQLAKILNVSKQAVSNWENDNIQPSVEMLEKIADAFSVTTDALLGRSNHNILILDGLTEAEIAHIRYIADDLRNNTKK